tara:strand:+ start:6284 stop:6667 length:384 start_codon:yes stop_codon:yes gene_type:complete
MDYLNTKWSFKPFEENNHFTFSIDKRDNDFTMDISIIKDDIEETMTNIPLQVCPNHVYRSKEISIKRDICYKQYIVNSIKFMLKFRNRKLSPVSSITLNCVNVSNETKPRIFTLNMNNIEKYGFITT